MKNIKREIINEKFIVLWEIVDKKTAAEVWWNVYDKVWIDVKQRVEDQLIH